MNKNEILIISELKKSKKKDAYKSFYQKLNNEKFLILSI